MASSLKTLIVQIKSGQYLHLYQCTVLAADWSLAMMNESILSVSVTKQKLREAVQELSARGLQKASTWALEQILGMPESDDSDCEVESANAYSGLTGKDVDVIMLARELLQSGEYQRCAHILQKYRCDSQNIPSGQRNKASHLHLYFSSYARYMAGEKLREQVTEERPSGSGNTKDREGTPANPGAKSKPKEVPAGPATETEKRYLSKNRNLQSLHAELARSYWDGHLSGDGFLLYIFAVVTRDLHRQEGHGAQSVLTFMKEQQQGGGRGGVGFEEGENDVTARQLFLESLHAFPWNWSCWLELSELCVSEKQPLPSWPDILHCQSRAPYNQYSAVRDSVSVAAKAGLESAASLMYGSFLTHVYLEKHCGELAMQVIKTAVEPVVPNSPILLTQVGLAQYTLRQYDEAEATFETARSLDPYRLAHMDTYSNILYVKEKRAELSRLAHAVVEVDKFCPESCCVVGNYYSLKGKHENAVTYFQRAIKLNSNYLSAWTLMGHEYMELRNTAAAVQCYRNAVGISEVDYRAWYGLGQTYEMLHLYQYAHYYYRKAAYLRPADARMWGAVGNCLLKLGLREQAIVGFERAVQCGDQEGVATRDLARLCREEGQTARAAVFYQKFLQISRFFEDGSGSNAPPSGSTQSSGSGHNPVQPSSSSLSALLGSPSGSAIGNVGVNLGNATGTGSGGMMGGAGGVVDAEQAEAVLFLARYHQAQGDSAVAESLCTRLQSFSGPEGEQARALLRSLQATRQPDLAARFPEATATGIHDHRHEQGQGGGRRRNDMSAHSTPGNSSVTRSASKTSRRQSGFHVFGSGGASHQGTPLGMRGRGGLIGAEDEDADEDGDNMLTPSQSLEHDYTSLSLRSTPATRGHHNNSNF